MNTLILNTFLGALKQGRARVHGRLQKFGGGEGVKKHSPSQTSGLPHLSEPKLSRREVVNKLVLKVHRINQCEIHYLFNPPESLWVSRARFKNCRRPKPKIMYDIVFGLTEK